VRIEVTENGATRARPTIRSGAATGSAVGILRPGDPQISWPLSIVSFDMPKNCRLFIGTDRHCSSGGSALSRHRAFVRLNNNFSLFNRHSNDLLGNMWNFS
jgi:hypothetical protein